MELKVKTMGIIMIETYLTYLRSFRLTYVVLIIPYLCNFQFSGPIGFLSSDNL